MGQLPLENSILFSPTCGERIATGKCTTEVHPRTGHGDPEVEQKYSSTLSLTSALGRGGWSTPRPGRFTPGKDPVPIVQEAGQVPGPVWTGAANLAATEIRSPDRPARSESLYRLSCPGPQNFNRQFCYEDFGPCTLQVGEHRKLNLDIKHCVDCETVAKFRGTQVADL